jgi:hypothetical protein
MTLIDKFESMPFQDVGTFNSIFRSTPILGYGVGVEVEIRGVLTGNYRTIYVGKDHMQMDLTQRKLKTESVNRVKRLSSKAIKETKFSNRDVDGLKLSPIFKDLKASEFLIYMAVKELGSVSGILELSRSISLTPKTIHNNIENLIKLGYLKKENIKDSKGNFTRLYI